MLLKAEKPIEAIAHYRRATEIRRNDQVAWLGLADAYRLADQIKEAESAYRTAVEINPHNDVAELARAGSNTLAQSSFNQVRETSPRQDIVQYCLAALQRFSKMDESELKKLTLELAMAGRNGLEVHNPNSRYHIKGLEGQFSGLAVVSYLFVAMQRIAPGTDVGFDVRKEYEIAKKMLAENA
jgi:tetratricopeptide (TPR) repeat protein